MAAIDGIPIEPPGNIDPATVEGFGAEWDAYDQSQLVDQEFNAWFEAYFHIFPWSSLPDFAEGFDLGCGSGRWAAGVAPKVGRLHCIDPAEKALAVAQRRLANMGTVRFHQASVDRIPLADGSQDFGYSLGVLHHVPDTAAALRSCVLKLKRNAPFLLYLYYALDTRPVWFRAIWRVTDKARWIIARTPFSVRKGVTSAIAAGIYYPLARVARLVEKMGKSPAALPLSAYRNSSFYTMRTDALDRFGTRLEQRFTREEIAKLMSNAGLSDIRFSESEPYWVAVGRRVL